MNPTGLPTTEGGTGHTLKQKKEFLQPDKPESEVVVTAAGDYYEAGEGLPSEEELAALRRVSAPMP